MHRKKILLVDDSSTVLMMEKFILRNDPYILITASTGEEAVEKAARELPDLVLLDSTLPRMSGVEACRAIRGYDALQHVPVIFVLACDGVAETEWIDCCADTVTKPINAVELLDKVRSLLGGRTEGPC